MVTQFNFSSSEWDARFGKEVDQAVINSLAELGGDDEPELLLELIDLFLEDSQVRVAALEQAYGDEDWESVVLEAHTLKGASSTMGAQIFSAACRVAEKDARANGLERNVLDQLLDLHQRSRTSLHLLRDATKAMIDGEHKKTA